MMTLLGIQLSSWGKGFLLMIMLFLLASCGGAKNQNETEDQVEAPKKSILEATFFGDLKTIKQHIKAGSDLNVKDDYGSAPLMIASMFGKTDVALALIEGEADIDITSADGSTPLHTAAFLCRTEIVEALIKKGADKTVKNNFGMTAQMSVLSSFDQVKPVYEQMARDLGPLGLKLDYEYLKATRPVIAELIGKK